MHSIYSKYIYDKKIQTYLLLVVWTPAPPVEALRSHPERLVGRQCASKRLVYLLGLPTVLPETNYCAMADLNMATDVLVLVL